MKKPCKECERLRRKTVALMKKVQCPPGVHKNCDGRCKECWEKWVNK